MNPVTVMQVSRTNRLEGGRGHTSIGRIRASAGWRAVNASAAEADRQAAVEALILHVAPAPSIGAKRQVFRAGGGITASMSEVANRRQDEKVAGTPLTRALTHDLYEGPDVSPQRTIRRITSL